MVRFVRDRLALLGMLRCLRRSFVVGLAAAMVLVTLMPAVTAVATGVLVRRVTILVRTDASLSVAAVPLIVVGLLLVFDLVFASLLKPVRDWASLRVSGDVREKVRAAVSAPVGIEHLEDQEFRDLATLPVYEIGGLHNLGAAADGQLWLLARFVGAGASALLVASYSIPLAAVMMALLLVLRSIVRRQYMATSREMGTLNRLKRGTDYWGDVAGSPLGGKEVRLYGFQGWALDEYSVIRREIMRVRRQHFADMLPKQWLDFVLFTAAAGIPFVVLTKATLDGRLTAAGLAVTLGGVMGVFGIGNMGLEAFAIEAGVRQLDALRRLQTTATVHKDTPLEGHDKTAAQPPVPVIEFQDVRFRYPGTARDVLRGLSLRIEPGQSLAVVGENGAGKTTLLKLLAGFYQPTAGRILVDGIDLASIPADVWRPRLAVIFQDFTHFELSLYDNITLARGDGPDDPAVVTAAQAAGALDLTRSLPSGWDTMLSRAYTGGAELSGGQWQRVALARALYAAATSAQVLVLDEPTANLDVHAETALFDQLLEHAAGLTSIVISHRFSTVRRAERIVVVDDGRVVEDGPHSKLVAAGGIYARLYRLQADKYVQPTSETDR